MKKKDILHYSGAAGIFLLVIFILLYFANNEIPTENKDIVVSITGMIVGSLTMVIAALVGRNPDEVKELTVKVESQQKHIEDLVLQKDAYEAQMITMQQEIIKAGGDALKTLIKK